MAKTYIDIVKYMVEAKFEISGVVEKPDIIGAVFGQTEGLLGADLDLRELQKNGKIGRIEIDATTGKSKTTGTLILPSSLARVETCILAAAIEAVDRVGPFDTSFSIIKVEDTRNEKRSRVINRAKELVKNMLNTTIPDSKEISELVEAEVKSSTVTLYGEDKLPAGPDISKSEDIILVEGRADIVNLLRNDITNCISVGGASGHVSRSIIELCKQKDVTVFLDGDRGGSMILNGLLAMNAEIDFVCRAPDGKEVEELTRKEIIKCLRFRVPIEQAIAANKSRMEENGYQKDRSAGSRNMRYPSYHTNRYEEHGGDRPRPQESSYRDENISSPSQISERLRSRGSNDRPYQGQPRHSESETRSSGDEPFVESIDSDSSSSEIKSVDFGESTVSKSVPHESRQAEQRYLEALEGLKNTLRGRLYSESGEVISEIPIRELVHTIENSKGVTAIVFDGIITQRLIDVANRSGIRSIYGTRPGEINRKYDNIFLYTSEKGSV